VAGRTTVLTCVLVAFATAPLSGQPTGTGAAEIDLETAVNGVDADSPPGPTVIVGQTVKWTHVVTNTGGSGLTNIRISADPADDEYVCQVASPRSRDVLQPGESVECEAEGVASDGQHSVETRVEAMVANIALRETSEQNTVSDQDLGHCLGEQPPNEGCTPVSTEYVPGPGFLVFSAFSNSTSSAPMKAAP
jgi:hypothetical protein